uniref:Uncharacterized protein n=1 Tax=Romanomermis culicivorax TaxID=13658 RepID=A0A915I411_ROMCU
VENTQLERKLTTLKSPLSPEIGQEIEELLYQSKSRLNHLYDQLDGKLANIFNFNDQKSTTTSKMENFN